MTIKSKQQYTQDCYMGAPIKCNKKHPTIESIIQAIYILVYDASTILRRPRGYHVRTRFANGMTCSEYSAHLNNYYKSKSGYIPLRITVTEEDESGFHQHHAVILDDIKDRKSSLQYLHAKLKQKGKLSDYSIIGPDSDKYGQFLSTLSDKDSYFKWMTYLAKTRTKICRHQLWSGSRTVTSMLAAWIQKGKPDLRQTHIDQHHTTNCEHDLSSFID